MAIRDPKMHFSLFVVGLLINLSICGAAFIWAGSSADSALYTKKHNRKATTGELPNYGGGWHTIGNIEFGINNRSEVGPSYFARGSDLRYLSVARWWFGGIIGRDTLVSAASSELHPGPRESDGVIHRSILKTSPDYHRDAVSEQDIICVFTDTITDIDIVGENPYENRPHIPLFIRIRHSTYAWSFDYAEDFILFDCWITNIGTHPIKKLFAGLRTAAQPVHRSVSEPKWEAHVGFRRTLDVPPGLCRSEDTVNIAWFADEDGDPTIYRQWDYRSLRAVMGFQILRPPPAEIITNFNWYVLEFGPRLAPTADDPYRPFAYPSAYPRIDVDRYYMLSHPEIDYDMMFAALNHSAEGFLPPGDLAEAAAIAGGTTGRYLFSFGPFDIEPGDSVPFTLAYIAGDNFHVNAWDYINYFDPFRPEIYYSKLDFSDLARNSRWARAIYDNPGVDTDGDGYRGESCWRYVWRDTTLADPADSFVVDSVRYFYTGDGVPDFRAVSPPPPPVVRTRPGFGKVTLRWNGQESETTPDYFSEKIDFEGYRVYVAKNDRLSDFVLLAGYDIDDYIIYAFDPDNLRWTKIALAAKHDSLKQVYGAGFDANMYYDEYHFFTDPYTRRIMYFVRQDWNQCDLSDTLGIHRVYPDASPHDSLDYTEEGWRRYYEYEYTIDNLEPSIPYYFAVTAFDYGSFKYEIGAPETSPLTNMVCEYALPSSEEVEARGLNVIVYPNPYRIDGGYARAGYENRDRTKSAERARRIHFGNLPGICTIRIYTVAGDLVREIKHYNPGGAPSSQHEEWNVISRNTQAVVTGIYIWHVRSEMGDQMGKLVIIK